MIFDSWDSLIRVLLVGSIGYAGTVVLLRISGNRTLSKLNSFDLVVTIAFGSVLSAIMVNRSISLLEGLVAIALLVLLQFIIAWLSVHSRIISHIVKTRPSLLLQEGRLMRATMKAVRVTEDEIRSAVRQHGFGDLSQIAAVVLETDGSLSVISVRRSGTLAMLEGVCGASAAMQSNAEHDMQ